MNKNNTKSIEEEILASVPETPEEAKQLIVSLTKELMDKSAQLKSLEAELKNAVRRKKVPYDPRTKHVAMVMFSRPKVDGAKVRMHTVDEVHGNLAITTVKRMMCDPDNEFIGAYLLMPMKGYKDAMQRMNFNAEAAWHLFEHLDRDIKKSELNSTQKS